MAAYRDEGREIEDARVSELIATLSKQAESASSGNLADRGRYFLEMFSTAEDLWIFVGEVADRLYDPKQGGLA